MLYTLEFLVCKTVRRNTIKLHWVTCCQPASEATKEYPDWKHSKEGGTFHKVNFPTSKRFWKLLKPRTIIFSAVGGMQTNESPVSEPGFLRSMCNSTSPQHRVFVQHEGTCTRGMQEQNSHQVKLQLIIIVTDNKACDKEGEATLTPFILDTKAKEMINLSHGYLREGCHLGRKEASGKPAVSKRKETSLSHTAAALSRCGSPHHRQVSLWETLTFSASILALICFL